ncbi:MAG: DUF3189 family protein [Bacillaceae bacterium]|nr:DUF3189 family protein [Bacillaceae bacterium]
MNVIYYCYGSAHSSIIAAHIHLGHLPSDRVPSTTEILSLSDFDTGQEMFIGSLFFKGIDEKGRRIYTMGMGSEPDIVKETFLSMIEVAGGDRRQYLFFSALPHINHVAKFGGTLSRRYGIVWPGRQIAVWGIRQSYRELVQFVRHCREILDKSPHASFKKRENDVK